MTATVPVPGAYGSFAPAHGAALYATPGALRVLAGLLRQVGERTAVLGKAPAELAEEGEIISLDIADMRDAPVMLGRTDGTLKMVGGIAARAKLAKALENLADVADQPEGPVQPHVDLEYFPGHDFLDPASMWMTVFLLQGAKPG